MKKLLPILVLLSSYLSPAQNYQCLQNGVKHYFTNNQHYVRAVFDTATAYTDSSVFSSFCTLRGFIRGISGDALPTTPGPGWLSDSVIMYNDGTYLFPTIGSDTIIIKSQAGIGDSWSFYNDTGINSYIATVTSIDTMTVLDSLDSVKTIQITAYASGMANPSDSLNNFQIKISKKYGFVQVFDLYIFPYYFNYDYGVVLDYYFNSVGYFFTDQIFKLIKYHTPTQLEIYDYNPGDVFEKGASTSLPWTYPCIGTSYNSVFLDSVVSKTILDPNHTQYIVHHYGYQIAGTSHASYDRMDTFTVSSAIIFHSTIPEQCDDLLRYYYHPTNTSHCYNSSVYETRSPIVYGFHTNCYEKHEYKAGFGETRTVSGIGGTDGCEGAVIAVVTEQLIFSIKNGDSCGTYAPPFDYSVAVNDRLQKTTFYNIFPNPADNNLTITSSTIIATLSITNLLGQQVNSYEYNADKVNVDISELPSGIYLIRINGTEVRKFVKR